MGRYPAASLPASWLTRRTRYRARVDLPAAGGPVRARAARWWPPASRARASASATRGSGMQKSLCVEGLFSGPMGVRDGPPASGRGDDGPHEVDSEVTQVTKTWHLGHTDENARAFFVNSVPESARRGYDPVGSRSGRVTAGERWSPRHRMPGSRHRNISVAQA